MADPEAVLDALAAGLSVEKAAKQFDLPVPEVRRMLRDEVERCRDGEHLREVWALADRRLAAVEHKFYLRALEGEGDPQAAIVFVKTNRSTLNGANVPQSHVLQVVSQPPEAAMTSTDRIEAALDHVMGITSRERELKNKQLFLSDEKLPANKQAELDQLRAEREAKRLAKLSQHHPGEPSSRPH